MKVLLSTPPHGGREKIFAQVGGVGGGGLGGGGVGGGEGGSLGGGEGAPFPAQAEQISPLYLPYISLISPLYLPISPYISACLSRRSQHGI